MMTTIKKASLTVRILIAMALGIIIGLGLQYLLADTGDYAIPLGFTTLSVKALLIDGVFHAGGQIFINSLQMLVVPLVFVSLVCGTSSLTDIRTLGRIGGKTLLLYILTTALAISLAISMALLLKPGAGINLPLQQSFSPALPPSTVQVFINMFPSNPVASMAQGEMLQIIVFAVLFGLSIALADSAGERMRQLFADLNEIVMKLVHIVMQLSPYGVFFLMAKQFTSLELHNLGNLGGYLALVFFVLLLHAFVVYGTLLAVLGRLNPLTFFAKMKETALFAFSTSSSNATIASNLTTTTHKLGVDNKVASFTVPLGATINMDGTAIMQGVATVFIAQVYNIELGLSSYLMVVLTATLASIGTAGVPGVGMVMLAMVLTSVGLPVEGIALIIGIDRLLDMTRTAVNISGDAMVSCLVARSEHCLDLQIFNNTDAGKTD